MHTSPLATLACACALLPLLGACHTLAGNGMTANAEDKAATLAAWEPALIDRLPAKQFIRQRTGLLLAGADGFRVEEGSPTPRGVALLHGEPVKELASTSACAIDARGYWLTAAHCLLDGPLLVATSDGREVRAWPARVVWDGSREDPQVDLALLHTDGLPFAVFAWAVAPAEHAPVLCMGAGVTSGWFSGGHVTRVRELDGQPRVLEIRHDAPLTVGDSGGPAMFADGALAGIDVLTQPRGFGLGAPESTALLPDESFVRGLIQADAARGQP